MANYEITYSCGHTETKQLCGKHSDRENYIEWASQNRVCSACYSQQKQQERQNQIATEKVECEQLRQSADIELPELTGTPKQIAWAKDILTKLLTNPATSLIMPALSERHHTAQYWIDRRNREPLNWYRVYFKSTKKGKWNPSWEKGTPQANYAGQIFLNHPVSTGRTYDTIMKNLTELTTLPIPDDVDYPGDHYDMANFDHWLICSWVRNGFIEFLAGQLTKNSNEQAQQVAQQADEAEARGKKAMATLAQADQIQAEAEEIIRESTENIAMSLGAKGYYRGIECALVGILQSGNIAVISSQTNNGKIFCGEEISRATWIAAAAEYRKECEAHNANPAKI